VNFSSRNPHELVIVFGANGFLGSVITKKLHKSGIAVLAVVRPTSDRSRIEGLKHLEVIVEESFNWPQLIEEYKPGAVICAQWRGVSKIDREDLEMQMSNIQPFADLALAAITSSVQTFICFGSQAESQKSIQKIAEEICNSGTTAYGRVKAQLYSNLNSIFNESKCRFVWARVFSVYGPSDSSDSLLMQLHESESQGIKLKIENPDILWSFLYEDDFAAAVERILQSTDIEGMINIGNPLLVEIQSIVDTWFEAPLKLQNRVGNDMASEGFFPELRKLMSIGWTSRVSLEEGIQRTREAYRRCFNSKY
jgi:nucleoside-diphosphate-sugar epimerase